MICSLELILLNGNLKAKLWRKEVSILAEPRLRGVVSKSRDQ